MSVFYSWFFSYLFAVIFSILLFRFKSNFYHKAAIKLTAKDKDYDNLINKSQIYKKRSFISIFVWSLIFSIIYFILVLTIHDVRQEFFVYLRTSKFNTIKIKRSFDDFVTDKIIAKEKQINKRQTNSIN